MSRRTIFSLRMASNADALCYKKYDWLGKKCELNETINSFAFNVIIKRSIVSFTAETWLRLIRRNYR